MSTPNTENHDYKFSQIEREMITRGAAAGYFATMLANLPDVPQQIKQEAQYFLWFGRCPVNVDVNGRVQS